MVSEQEWDVVEWLKDARSLLRWLNILETGPVFLMLRHSERPEDSFVWAGFYLGPVSVIVAGVIPLVKQ